VLGQNFDKILLEKYFYNNKGWSVLFSNRKALNDLYGNCLDFNNNKTINIEEIISKNDYNQILSQVNRFKAFDKIIKEKLNKNIKVVGLLKKEDVVKLTKPIFFSDKAVLLIHRDFEEKLLIFKMNKKMEWVLICEKYLFIRSTN